LAGILAATAGCGKSAAELAAASVKPPRIVPVTVTPLERRTVERTVDVIGSLRGWEQVTVGSKKAGRVVRVLHDIGDKIKPGEPLVELDPVDARLGVEQAETKYLGELVKLGLTRADAERIIAQYGMSEELLNGRVADETIAKTPPVVQKKIATEKAQQNLNRQHALTKRGAGTQQELDDAESAYRTAVADYEGAVQTARNVIAAAMSAKVALSQAEQTLKDVRILAPNPKRLPPGLKTTAELTFALTRRPVSEGQMIREGDSVAELVIDDPIRLWVQVPEHFVDSVKVGQPARVSTRAHPDMTFAGTISRINPAVDTASRTFQVETLVPNPNGLLRPGGFARASIVTNASALAAVVPPESIIRYAGVTKLFIVENQRARAISDIETGLEGRGWVEVISKELPANAQVVTTGQTQLANQTMVVIKAPEPAEPPTAPVAALAPAPEPAAAAAPSPKTVQ
jgi:multidrug efflux pump subunit AcrA (membrane-fusion protein)